MTSTSTDGDARAIAAQTRVIEVQDASDRLGLAALRETLTTSEQARRTLTGDIISVQARHDLEMERVRDEYERAGDASERRHASESLRWRDERDRLHRQIQDLERDAKDAKKDKKRAKKKVATLEIKLTEIRDKGETTRSIVGLLAPGVPPLAEQAAKHIPDLFAYLRKVVGPIPGISSSPGSEEEVLDRAAAIRFAGRLFDQRNSDLLDDLKQLAFDVTDDCGTAVIVNEWDRVQRYLWSAIQREATQAAAQEVQSGS